MEPTNGTERHDAPQPDVVAEMVAAALATRPTALRTSPYDAARQEAADDAEYAAEWALSADALAHDENAALRLLAHQRADVQTHTAWLESQLADARRKQHAAEARALAAEQERAEALNPEPMAIMKQQWDDLLAERDGLQHQVEALGGAVRALTAEVTERAAEIRALREERDTLAAKLDAAHAELSKRENAALVSDADVCAGQSAAALYREVMKLRVENDQLRAQQAVPTHADLVVRGPDSKVYPLASQARDECDSPAAVRMDSETERKARTQKFEPPVRSKPDAAA